MVDVVEPSDSRRGIRIFPGIPDPLDEILTIRTLVPVTRQKYEPVHVALDNIESYLVAVDQALDSQESQLFSIQSTNQANEDVLEDLRKIEAKYKEAELSVIKLTAKLEGVEDCYNKLLNSGIAQSIQSLRADIQSGLANQAKIIDEALISQAADIKQQVSNSISTAPQSFAEVLSKGSPLLLPPVSSGSAPSRKFNGDGQTNKHILILRSKTVRFFEQNKSNLFTFVNSSGLDIRINKVEKISKQDLAIELVSAKDADSLLQAFESHNSISDSYTLLPPKPRYPQFLIHGVPKSFNSDSLQEELILRNPVLTAENFKINFQFKFSRRDTSNFVFSVNPAIYREIVPLGGLFINSVKHSLTEYVPVRICTNCGTIGHGKSRCTQRACCLRCGDVHPPDRRCELCCINCARANSKFRSKFYTDHDIRDPDCPQFLRNKEYIISHTIYNP